MGTVYVETTVIGSIAGRIQPNAAIAVQQQISRNWWSTAANRYRLVISQLTIDECAAGDSDAAKERLDVIRGIDVIVPNEAAERLAELLIQRKAVPESQPRDALHIALAAVKSIEFIVTWNFKHILNPHVQARIAAACREFGYDVPVICTPQQLLETEDGNA